LTGNLRREKVSVSWHLQILSETISALKKSKLKLLKIGILFITGLLFYAINYITGILLYFQKIYLPKKLHQLMFAVVIINLVLILIFEELSSLNFIICSLSLLSMLILPFGKKGGKFHILISSTGLLLYTALIYFIC